MQATPCGSQYVVLVAKMLLGIGFRDGGVAIMFGTLTCANTCALIPCIVQSGW